MLASMVKLDVNTDLILRPEMDRRPQGERRKTPPALLRVLCLLCLEALNPTQPNFCDGQSEKLDLRFVHIYTSSSKRSRQLHFKTLCLGHRRCWNNLLAKSQLLLRSKQSIQPRGTQGFASNLMLPLQKIRLRFPCGWEVLLGFRKPWMF